jgi:glycine betaine/choline ABC-type transport system substrate-binding protein
MDRRRFLSGMTLLATGCMAPHHGVTVGSKNFTEQLILGEMLAQYLERTTEISIQRRFYLAGTYICQQALLAGRIDTYVEYTGTALAAVLKERPFPGHDQVFNEVKKEYLRKFNLMVLPPLGFNNSFAIVMRGPQARQLGVHSLSELGRFAPRLRMGVGYEFLERQDGYKGLVETYGLHFAEEPRVMDLGLLYRALENDQVDLIAGGNTDGLISALDVVVLQDDRHYFPPYDAVPIVRHQTLDEFASLGPAINRLSGKITAEEMRNLNYAVDGEERDASNVATEFLASRNYFGARNG